MSLTDSLRTLLVLELNAAWLGHPSPTRKAAAAWLDRHGLDLLVGAVDWLRDDDVRAAFEDARRDILVAEKPGLAKVVPVDDDRSQGEILTEWHGAVAAHRGPWCAKCRKRVDSVALHMTDATPRGFSAAASFICHGDVRQIVFDEDLPDEMIGPWARMQVVFDEGKAS